MTARPEQLPLYQTHSPTSRAAAESIAPRVGTLKTLVLEYIRAHGPVSDEQISDGLVIGPSTCRPRRIELWRECRIRQKGEGKTSAGRRCALWVIA